MSRGIHVETSVLMSRLQISFPAASSSLAGQQHADMEGGILQLTASSSYSNWWESCLLLEIYLILTQKNTIGSQLDLLHFLGEIDTALVIRRRRCFPRYAKKKSLVSPTFTFRNINFITFKTYTWTWIPIRQSSCYTSASQINCTQTPPIFHTYLKETFLNFMGSSVLKSISVHKYHRHNIKTQHKYESRRPFN